MISPCLPLILNLNLTPDLLSSTSSTCYRWPSHNWSRILACQSFHTRTTARKITDKPVTPSSTAASHFLTSSHFSAWILPQSVAIVFFYACVCVCSWRWVSRNKEGLPPSPTKSAPPPPQPVTNFLTNFRRATQSCHYGEAKISQWTCLQLSLPRRLPHERGKTERENEMEKWQMKSKY